MANCSEDCAQPNSPAMVEFYHSKLKDMKHKYSILERVVEECRQLVVRNADKEDEFLRHVRDIAKLRQAMSDLEQYLYKEREYVLKLTADNDKLRIEAGDNRRKIQFLLDHSGLKESQLEFHKERKDGEKSPLGKPKGRPRFYEVKDFNQKLKELWESENDILNLRIKALEAELREQTILLRDEVSSLEKDLDLKKREWESEKMQLEQRISCLNCRLQNTLLKNFDDVLKTMYDFEKARTREVELVEENECLKRYINTCKGILGEDFPTGHVIRTERVKSEARSLKEQLHQKDQIIKGYQTQADEFEAHIQDLKAELLAERTQSQKLKERFLAKEEYFSRKLEEEKKRRLLETEGFQNDVKILRSKLHAIERQIKMDRLKKRIELKEKRES
ncbi:hypothetical protein GE061_014597 [Apolygus lucorum]|uniref:Coiled-coil domain-containing protein 77 n=1 Tax=Apolygus lucorum TaxID=248454 RepID=A0A8S9XMN7_APOLU|nr:hypothetical protein GE061_014597 [Apolygus lucorum]